MKRRKLKGRQKSLKQVHPHSPELRNIEDELSILAVRIRDSIEEDLSARERKAVECVKNNPRYFFGYAKKFSKLRSNIGPLKDGKLVMELFTTVLKRWHNSYKNCSPKILNLKTQQTPSLEYHHPSTRLTSTKRISLRLSMKSRGQQPPLKQATWLPQRQKLLDTATQAL